MSNYSDTASTYSDDSSGSKQDLKKPKTTGKRRSPLLRLLDPRDFGVLHVLILLIVVFSIWQPDTFPTYQTFTAILSQNAIPGILALGLTVPLAAGEFDLSIGYVLGTASIFVAWCLGSTGMSVPEAMVLTMAICIAFGIINSLLVVGVGLNSFIATLATGSLLQAVIQTISGGLTLAAGVPRIGDLATTNIAEITLPALIMVGICGLLWLLLSLTASGRRIYATGLARDAAVLSGIRTARLRVFGFVVSAVAAGIAGILVTAQVGAASPTVGPPLMIPAFAAAFLGSTQVRPGFFNAWGTLLAVLMLGTLNYGLALAGVPDWVPYLSTGSVLIVALALGRIREQGVPVALKRLFRRRLSGSPTVATGDGTA